MGRLEDLHALADGVLASHAAVDVLVNNAAANPVFGPVEDTAPEAFAKIMDVNLRAPFELAKRLLPGMTARGGGSIINISSIGGVSPEAHLGIYSVSKAALISLTEVMAREWGGRNVRANAICPGLIKTDFSRALWDNPRTARAIQRAAADPAHGRAGRRRRARALSRLTRLVVLHRRHVHGRRRLHHLASTSIDEPIPVGRTLHVDKRVVACAGPRVRHGYAAPDRAAIPERVVVVDRARPRGGASHRPRVRSLGAASPPRAGRAGALAPGIRRRERRVGAHADRALRPQLPGAGHRQHGVAARTRLPRAAGTVPRTVGAWRDSLLLRDDRTGARRLQPDVARHPRRT